MSEITTHVLDVARGVPAAGIDVTLERGDADGGFTRLGRGTTDADGRIMAFGAHGSADTAVGRGRTRYRLTFAVGAYFAARSVDCFFPEVQVVFEANVAAPRHHVPLLLSPFGYSTYRGS